MIEKRKITKFFLQGTFCLVCAIGVIVWLDIRGVYDEKDSDHVEQRWESLYSFQDSVEIDMLMIGNSHAFTSVIPKLLSAGTGMTSFVLANNGTILGDSYWSLREALELCNPQLVLVETTGIDMQELKQDNSSFFVNQLRAFHARRNWRLKLRSTPELFNLDDWATAWSPTVQNHHLFWTDPERMRTNIDRGAPTLLPSNDRLFLGRYSRFESGLTDSTLALYDSLGPTLDGYDFGVSDENKDYADRIMNLAREKGFEVAFVSTPMFIKHWKNVEQRNAALADLIQPLGTPWLNLQNDETLTKMPSLFENTIGKNQHMSILGSFEVTHRLIRWINENKEWKFSRPGWDGDVAWHKLFAAQDGYLSFYPSLQNHPGAVFRNRSVFIRRRGLPTVEIAEVIFFAEEKHSRRSIDCFAKVYPTKFKNGKGPARNRLQLAFDYKDRQTNEIKNRKIRLSFDYHASSDSIWLFRAVTERVQVQKLTGGNFIPR